MAFIALGVTGGIGAYKAVEVARGLQKNGHDVVVVMTRSAEKFVGPLTFEAITRRPVITDQYQPGANAGPGPPRGTPAEWGGVEHIAIASNIDRTASTFSSPSGSASGMVKRVIAVMVGTPRAEAPTGDLPPSLREQGTRRRRTCVDGERDA